MNIHQRRTFFILFLIGTVYFALFIVPNSYGARSDAILLDASADEHVTYPNVLRILTPGKTFYDWRANLFLYEDYHYGYPFYAFSALVLLPARLIAGEAFYSNMQMNMLLLRQFISLLPMVLAAGLLVWVQTRFQPTWKAVALFVFLLTVRGVVRNHIWWWHPDALAVLFVVLTIFFLDRDNLRFGRNFYFAAAACGLAVSIKLLGFFFFLTIPAYLLYGLWKKHVTFPRALLAGVFFVIIMMATAIFTNPWIFSDDQRARAIEIQQEKSQELAFGYEHDDPLYYSKGPQWWVSTLEKWYAHPLFLLFLLGSVIAGSVWGPRKLANRIILTWVLPYSIYLLYFVAVKPDHYWLPVMLPLFSSAFIMLDLLLEKSAAWRGVFLSRRHWLEKAALVAVVALLTMQVVVNIARPASGFVTVYKGAIDRGMVQIETIR